MEDCISACIQKAIHPTMQGLRCSTPGVRGNGAAARQQAGRVRCRPGSNQSGSCNGHGPRSDASGTWWHLNLILRHSGFPAPFGFACEVLADTVMEESLASQVAQVDVNDGPDGH